MDALDQALAQVRAEIEHIKEYLAKLQEAERELVMVRETRQAIAQGWQASHANVSEKIAAPDVAAESLVAARPTPEAHLPLATAILHLLQTSDRAMTPLEIDTALRSVGRQMHKNAVTSKLSALAKSGTVVKQEGAKYSLPSRTTTAITPERPISEKAVPRSRPKSLATQVHAVLQEVGKPLTGNEIVEVLRAKGQDIKPASVITALYHMAQYGEIFRRVGSKTFGLLEWPEQPNGHDGTMGLLDMPGTPKEDLNDNSATVEYKSSRDVNASTEGDEVRNTNDNNNIMAAEELE
jgi:Fe2+ or Zn2+ uptake regulation protein